MNQPIKSITFKGELEVWGVYNYNGAWSVLKKQKTQEGKEFYSKHRCNDRTPPKRDNHIYAKTFLKDKGKEIDYTSSRCIRHELFKDLQPRQPSDKAFAEQFIQMVASEVGLLRGYMFPDKGLKRCSPLHIADALTIEDKNEIDIVFDQGSSSKPKESDKKNKKGEDISDNTMFSKDNVPHRRQELFGGINLKELQFLSLDDNDFCMILKNEQGRFVELLEEYFKKHNVNSNLEIKKYIDFGSIYTSKRTGVLLNQDQIRHLVKVVFQRIRMLNGLKANARLAYKKNSLQVSFLDGEITTDVQESDLRDKLKNMSFYHFFKSA